MRILYLDLDALNPTHLSCYGYPRKTSPTIDAIAGEGVRHANVYCSDAPCLPSRTAFYQGRFGIQTGVVGHGGTAADPKRQGATRSFRSVYEEQSLPRRLQVAGYHTAMISPFGQRHAAHQFYAGYHEIHNTGRGGMEDVVDVDPVLHKWLDDHAADDDWYLHVNFWDIHTPYRAPESYGEPFADSPLPERFTDPTVLEKHVARGGPHSAQDPGMYGDNNAEKYPRLPRRITDRDSLKQWIDGYDTAIRYVDDAIARVVQKLKAAGVYDDTAIVISADHGENQMALGIYGEHGTADHGTCHIPFIVRWPGQTKTAGSADDGLHYHLDWAPTLLELLGRSDDTPGIWDGTSFASTITDGDDQGRSELIVSQCCHVCQRGVRFEEDGHRWMYIRTYHDGYHPFPDHMLYDLAADPLELDNVAAQHPDVVREASFRLSEWHTAQMHRMAEHASDVVDPLWTVVREGGPFHAGVTQEGQQPGSPEKFRAYLDRLEATGRSGAADDLRRRYPEVVTAGAGGA
ncbi:MAG: sulfatase [Planctomycetota bacterium]